MKRFYQIITVVALIVASTAFSANAQIYYGVKAGANVSSVSAKNVDANSEFGYQAGVVVGAKIPIIGIGVEAEGLWVNNKMSFSDKGGDVVSNSFEVPVMASIPLLPMLPIALKVGPSFVLYNKAKVTYADAISADLDPVKSSVGYTVGLGLKLSKITFDVRYNGQFKSATPFKGIENIVSKYDIKANTFSASLGYRF